MASHEEMVTLHRYFIWGDRMRVHFDNAIKDKSQGAQINHFLYMSFWYGELYVVIEGWKELNLTDDNIDQLLESPNVDLLRRYRNGAFHFQKKYFDDKFHDFWKKSEETVPWVRLLNEAFSQFFLDYFKQ